MTGKPQDHEHLEKIRRVEEEKGEEAKGTNTTNAKEELEETPGKAF